MQSRMLRRLAAAAVLGLAAGVSVVSTAEARPSRPSPRVTRGGFNLFAGAVNVLMNINRVQCNITNFGNQCVDPNGSPVIGGGFWPKGSPDQYIFNGGLQIGAIVCYDATCATPGTWKGDTVGVYFMDPRGDQRQGDAITNIYNSANADDAANWPANAVISDTSLYAPSLIGRNTISQMDTWVRYWDGNTDLTTGRTHTMGVLVEQRGLAWNFPAGNEDIVYFLFRFINITSGTRADYDNLLNDGYTSGQIDEIYAIAQDFRSRAQSTYNVTLPAGGYTFHNTFVNYFQDADEGNAGFNYSTATLPFAETNVVKSDFSEPTWAFPPNIFGAPFAAAPGFEGVKYLKSPINPVTGRQFGITIWSNTCNGCGVLNDAVGVSQMYRYISGTPSTALGDASCSVANPLAYHTCGAIQTPADTRFFMSSGPFDLKPGQSSVIVVAMVHAAPVAQEAATGSGIYALPAWSLTPFITPGVGTLTPGIPATPETLAVVGASKVRNIERAEGWAAFSDVNGDGSIEQSEVQTVPRSLLDKDKVAQAVFDNKFLLPFAPESPLFFLVPGDGQVTVAWQKSASEATGDPYFNVAKNPLNPDLTVNALYDPDYRQFDVEGYRIWRGRTQADMQVIAQFDYQGTQFVDYTGQVYDSNHPNCAPELGLGVTPDSTTCGVPFTYPYTGTGRSKSYDIAGNLVQIPPGGRVQLANGNVFILQADTAVSGGGSGFSTLNDNGVPFAYVDNAIRNGFTYFYAVTAFDVNSVKSGPTSLESPLVARSTTPRAEGTNAQPAVIVTGLYGDDNVQLNPLSPWPTIDPATGAFSGIIPPTNSLNFGFLASVAEALPPGDITAKIDSVGAGFVGGIGTTPNIYVSLISGSDTVRRSFNLPVPSFSSSPTTYDSIALSYPLVSYDSTRARRLHLAFTQDARMPVKFSMRVFSLAASDYGNALINGRYGVPGGATAQASQYLLHSRWFDEGSAEPPQPTINPFGSAANTNGKLTGVSIIMAPEPYRQPIGSADHDVNVNWRGWGYSSGAAFYPADFVVTWGAGGAITVRDSTHHITLPFRVDLGPGWGFVNERTFGPSGIASTDLDDGEGTVQLNVVGYHHGYGLYPVCDPTWWGINCTPLQNTAELEGIDYTGDGAPDGNGIALVVNGQLYLMVLSGTSLPAAGTKWHLRQIGGSTLSATCTPGLPTAYPPVTTSCSNYSYTPPQWREGYVPGLSVKLRVTQAFEVASTSGDMSNIHTVPDPYYVTNALEITANTKVLRFVNLPDRAIIRIYSTSGILVNVLTHNDNTGGGEQVWNLRNRNNQFVASGVYFYHVEGPDGKTKIGRFTVVNFAQ